MRVRCGLGLALWAIGCAAEPSDDPPWRDAEAIPPPVQQVPAPLVGAHCQIMVDNVGLLDMETEYLPRVIRCENGGANLEALKAQAIAARSVAYYAIETSGSICDSQGCQVYGCAGDPEPIHYQAVEETAGVYLMYNSTLTYGFYVAGDSGASGPTCVGTPGASSTEQWVTYNEGLSGTSVQQTELGFVHDPGDVGYGQNRGCMSQWSARCLENELGYDVVDIVRFFYGDDVEMVQAPGECVAGEFTTGADAGSSSDGEGDGVGLTGGVSSATDGGLDDATGGGLDADGGGGPGDGPDDGALDSGDDAGATSDPGGGADPFDEALPDTYGGAGSPAGCACTTTCTLPPAWLLLIAVLVPLRRRR